MSPTLFSFAWTHSRARQLFLLVATLATLPVLYLTLEAPKQIVNEAIGGEAYPISTIVGDFDQLEYLALWCGLFLLAVIAGGVMKMQLNLWKGVLSERLLRRLRYALIERIHRFPLVHFRRTGQGELTSMVTAEAEPLGGIMGTMIATPVFQAGQMLTIVLFLFIQNVWLALAAVALIPVQAYLIPLIQRRVNRLNKERIVEVRSLSENIGENVAGMEDLRANGMLRYALAKLSARLGRIFKIRYQIYRLKFFMKFLNNFINQLTPFFFFAIGGYLVIVEQLTLGALVAALAAFKDLSAPWKELLAFYNQYQDMSVRYQTLIQQFDPPGLMRAPLYDEKSSADLDLAGPIRFENVTIAQGPSPVLSGLNFEIPKGATVAVESKDAVERAAFLNALTRGVAPRSGRIVINGHDLADPPQDVIGRRVGAVSDRPFLFKGPVGLNVVSSLFVAPRTAEQWSTETRRDVALAVEDGASPDPFDVDWIDYEVAEVSSLDELRQWWLRITEAMGTDAFLMRRALTNPVNAERRAALATRIVELRPKIRARLADAGLAAAYRRFDRAEYHPRLAVAENALFAVPNAPLDIATMSNDPEFRGLLAALTDVAPIREISIDLLDTLIQVFGDVGADHPLYETVALDPAHFRALHDWRRGRAAANDLDLEALMLMLPFKVAAERFPDAFDETFRANVLRMRQEHGEALLEPLRAHFTPLDEEVYAPGLTLLDNALFGLAPRSEIERLTEVVGDVLIEEGLKAEVAITVADVESGIGGSALSPVARERIGLARAVVKRPDVLVLNCALSNHTAEERQVVRARLRELLPEATMIFLEPAFLRIDQYDLALKIENGRIVGGAETAPAESGALSDLEKKARYIRNAPLFASLAEPQIRLLAYASAWRKVAPGEYFFRHGDKTDGVYLVTKGRAELRWPTAGPDDPPLSEVLPGRVIGDLSVILHTDRTIDMIAIEETYALRIRAAEYMQIIESDSAVAASLLTTVSGYLVVAATNAYGDPTIGDEAQPEREQAPAP